jgi:hypothetical protein
VLSPCGRQISTQVKSDAQGGYGARSCCTSGFGFYSFPVFGVPGFQYYPETRFRYSPFSGLRVFTVPRFCFEGRPWSRKAHEYQAPGGAHQRSLSIVLLGLGLGLGLELGLSGVPGRDLCPCMRAVESDAKW